MNYDSPKEIGLLLEREGLALKKRFGQNFLVSAGVRSKLLKILAPEPHDYLWEIGPGVGTMTELLMQRVERLIAFEIDHGFVRYLGQTFGASGSSGVAAFEIVPGDFLKTWREVRERAGEPDLLFGNLPYSSAATMLGSIIEEGLHIPRIVVTLQREVAGRLAAVPGSAEYSALSLLCQFGYRIKTHGDVAPTCFYPPPEVTSTIVELVARQEPEVGDRELFFRLVHDLFAARRKTIRNNLLAGSCARTSGGPTVLSALERSGLDPHRRGETLAPAEVAKLCRLLAEESR